MTVGELIASLYTFPESTEVFAMTVGPFEKIERAEYTIALTNKGFQPGVLLTSDKQRKE